MNVPRSKLRLGVRNTNSGVAAVEFALLAPLLIFVVALIIDFGIAFYTQLCLLSAAAAGAQYIQYNGGSLAETSYSSFVTAVKEVVANVSGMPTSPTVEVAVNNSSDGSAADDYYCVSGSPPSWTKMSSSVSICETDLIAGKFVTLTISTSLENIFPADEIVSAVFPLKETIIVRVK